ncbi:MAG: 3-deoxy-D-manno-octulosonic acid kinase [Succinivibrio sp.]|jgi:hypothetical protein|nr:3-deoxy-D-manno-octulosonic acid kinase [Succinivibrio sp.]
MAQTLQDDGYVYLTSDAAPVCWPRPLPEYFSRERILALGARACGGRGKTLIWNEDGQALALRHYIRGGLWGKAAGDRFIKFAPHAHRAFDEFRLLEAMREQGLPVPRPLMARERCSFGIIRQDIVIEALAARDLAAVLQERKLTAAELAQLGSTVREFFKAGVRHTDLNIRNILLGDDGKFWIIDFDRCFMDKADLKTQRQIIARLHRSFLKEQRRGGAFHYDDADFALLECKAVDADASR